MKFLTYLIENYANGNWIKPFITDEVEELTLTSEILEIDEKKLISVFNNGKLIQLTTDIWNKLENTDSSEMEQDDYNSLKKYSNEYNRDYNRIISGIKQSQNLPAPIVLHLKDENRYYLVAGNTRLMVCRVLGIQPKVFLLTI